MRDNLHVRRYYSLRTGKNEGGLRFTLEQLQSFFLAIYEDFSAKDYFQEHFGYWCVDAQDVPGKLGSNLAGKILLLVRKHGLWPIGENILNYGEDDVFDMIEFLFDHVSKPLDGRYHSFGSCGHHYTTFDVEKGREEFRQAINQILVDYGEGYELSDDGEVLTLGQPGVATLESAALPEVDGDNVNSRVAAAVRKFRRHRSTVTDRRDAIRDLADVLEFLRPQLKTVLLEKDEADLFNIANNFAIRHHNEKQKTNYDKPIWYSWIFYFYLATIHAGVRLLEKRDR